MWLQNRQEASSIQCKSLWFTGSQLPFVDAGRVCEPPGTTGATCPANHTGPFYATPEPAKPDHPVGRSKAEVRGRLQGETQVKVSVWHQRDSCRGYPTGRLISKGNFTKFRESITNCILLGFISFPLSRSQDTFSRLRITPPCWELWKNQMA